MAPALDALLLDKRSNKVDAVSLTVSLLAHALLAAAAMLVVSRPIPAPPVRSIAVEILSAARFDLLTRPVPEAVPLPPPTAPATNPASPQATEADGNAGEIVATRLEAGAILADPANRAVRDTLPKLDPFERMIQLCNVEAVEQIRLAVSGSHPDSVAAASFADAVLENGVLVATGGAYRNGGEWYRLSYHCAPAADLLSVTAFSLHPGDPIPKSEWEAHNLIAEDEDED